MCKTNGENIMKTKIAVLALIAVTAGVFTYKQTKHIPPSDLRDAVADATESKDFDTSIPDLKSENTDKAKMELPVVKSASYDFGDRSFPIRCTTQGDALSEVIITENSRGSIIRVVGMDGKSEIYYVDAFLFSALAHAAIRPDVDAIGSKKGA